MAKLILSLDDVVLEDIPLTKERTTIGRKPHNDIHIDNLAVAAACGYRDGHERLHSRGPRQHERNSVNGVLAKGTSCATTT
jgi:hypothetical protein